jgi:hypothetical protein
MWVYHTSKLVSKNTCPKKKIDTPTKNNQLQHIVVKVMGEQGKGDILSRVRSIAQGGAIVRTRA